MTLLTEAPATAPVVVKVKSELSTPVTVSLNVTVKLTLAAFVGSDPARVIDRTDGFDRSTV